MENAWKEEAFHLWTSRFVSTFESTFLIFKKAAHKCFLFNRNVMNKPSGKEQKVIRKTLEKIYQFMGCDSST